MGIGTHKGQKILDFGCGTGRLAIEYLLPLAEKTDSTIVGLDVSEEMIQHAIENYAGVDRIQFKCGNIMSNDFELGESDFDHIVSFYVLHFIKDYKEALRRLYGLLKPGGKCGLIISARYNQFPCNKFLGEDPRWSQYMKGYEEFCPVWTENGNYNEESAELAKSLIGLAAGEVGFKMLDLKLSNMARWCDSFNVHVEFLLTLNPFTNNVPKERHAEMHQSLRTHLCKMYGYPDTEEFHTARYFEDHYEALTVVLERPTS
jgi:SAM-dependent methyltransferase